VLLKSESAGIRKHYVMPLIAIDLPHQAINLMKWVVSFTPTFKQFSFQAIFLSSFDLKPTVSMYLKSLDFLDVQLVDLFLTQKALYGYVCTAGVNLAYGLHS
jgi:hypothetical protein